MQLVSLSSGSNKYYGSDEREDYLIYGLGGKDTLGGNEGNDTIYGGSGNDKLYGYEGDDILEGGKDSDTLYSGDGNDIFVYNSGDGKDLIYDYEEEDIIQFKSVTLTNSNFKKSGSNVIITVGSGNITVRGAADKVITYTDASGTEKTYPKTVNISGKTVTLLENYNKDTFDIAAYDGEDGATYKTINASAVENELSIVGNKLANSIIGTGEDDTINGGAGKDTINGGDGDDSINGGTGNDSLYGGAGNDTLTGGSGSDIFVYAKSSGKDVITDYDEADTIKFTSGTADDINISVSGNDVVFGYSKNHKITVKNAASKTITYIVGNQEYTWPDDPVNYNAKGTSATLLAGYTSDEFTAANTSYASKLVTINASAVNHDLSITGNSLANRIIGTEENDYINGGAGKDTILGGDGNDTIMGGTGNDSLTGGNGADVFVFRSGDGNDIITDYSNEDIISLASGSVRSANVNKNDDYVLSLSGGGKVTVVGSANKYLHVVDASGNETWYPEQPPAAATISRKKIILTEGFFDESMNINTYTEAAAFKKTIVTIDASAVEHGLALTGNSLGNRIIGTGDDDYIDGGSGKDTILGGDGNDTIYGGKGNDSLTGGDGADVFVYSSGHGNDVITDYSEEDIIQFTSGTATAKTVGNNVVFTLGSGKITVTGGKEHVITYADSEGTKLFPTNPLQINSAGTGATLKSNYRATTFDATTNAYVADVADILKTINGSQVAHDLEIIGNTKANRIIGGEGDDSLNGGKGNDTLTGGSGEDVFVYNSGDGKDVITDYNEGEDVINIASGTVSKITRSGSKDTFKVGSGTITLQNVKNKTITYMQNGEEILWNGKSTLSADSDSAYYTVSSDGESVVLSSRYRDSSFNVNDQSDTEDVYNINATAVTGDLVITGNSKSNKIYGAAGNNTIYGGRGNDTLYGGDGANIYVYNNGDGNDRIMNWGSSDSISIASGNLSGDIRTSGDTVILTVGKGKISLQGAVGESIDYWYDGEAQHTIVSGSYDVFEDNNYEVTPNNLSTLVQNKAIDYSAAQDDNLSLTPKNSAVPVITSSKK